MCIHEHTYVQVRENMNSTTYAKRTLYKPIDFFFRGVVDYKGKTKKVAFVDVFQVLNDRYLGRMSVCNYFYIAETSVRINELNVIALDELRNYDLVMRENFLIPDNLVYSVPISVRFLENDKDFDILLSTLKENKYKKTQIILTFFSGTLAHVSDEAKARYARLRKAGYKTCISAFGEDYNSLDLFGEFNFDYLRCEAQYFDASPNKKKVLEMLVKFCASSKVQLIMEGVDAPAQVARFKREGVKLLTGRGVSKLSRWVTNEFLMLKDPEGEKKEAYLKKLQKELDAKGKEEEAELIALRNIAIEKARADGEKVMPTAPRPELAKSPYQVRLEKQRRTAHKAAEEYIERAQAKLIVQDVDETPNTDGVLANKTNLSLRYEGDVQNALALSFAAQSKSELGVDRTKKGKKKAESAENVENVESENIEQPKTDEPRIIETVVDLKENSIGEPIRPTAPPVQEHKTPKKRKRVKADFDKEEKLFNEYRNDSMFGGLGMSTGMKGFGVTMKIDSKEDSEPALVGSYNDRGQWVDEDGNVFDGYFDVEGNWVEYEQYDSEKEGHYNDKAQWVDPDGNVYDGYFDEEGRWIDYTYTDSNGEVVDNGYFDDSIGKWVPFGYFAGDGTYHKF